MIWKIFSYHGGLNILNIFSEDNFGNSNLIDSGTKYVIKM